MDKDEEKEIDNIKEKEKEKGKESGSGVRTQPIIMKRASVVWISGLKVGK